MKITNWIVPMMAITTAINSNQVSAITPEECRQILEAGLATCACLPGPFSVPCVAVVWAAYGKCMMDAAS